MQTSSPERQKLLCNVPRYGEQPPRTGMTLGLGLSEVLAKPFPSECMKFHVDFCATLDLTAQLRGERASDNQRLRGRRIRARVCRTIGKRPAQTPARDDSRRFEVFLASHDVNGGEPADRYLPQEGRRQIRQLIWRIQSELSCLGIVKHRSSNNRKFTFEKTLKWQFDCGFPLTGNLVDIWVSKRN